MIAAYEKAVQAMGERWGDDEFISFIELGGLGHWGEWHVDSTAGIRQLPDKSIRERVCHTLVISFSKCQSTYASTVYSS